MLVMAALRGSDAQAIFRAADTDGDGSLSFQEWLAWLQRGDRSNDEKSKPDFSSLPGDNMGYDDRHLDSSLTTSLGLVLSHAVSTLKVWGQRSIRGQFYRLFSLVISTTYLCNVGRKLSWIFQPI